MYVLRRRLVFLVFFTVAVLALTTAAHAKGSHDPHDDHGKAESHAATEANGPDAEQHANSGSVKVDDDEVDDQPANHPHVLCALRVAVNRSFGVPVAISFDAHPPTTRADGSQELLVVNLPAGDNVTDLIDLSGAVAGITPHPQQGFHVLLTLHLPGGGEKHKVFWASTCPTPTTTSTTPTTTAPTIAGSVTQATTTTSVPTQVLGEHFAKTPASTTLANTGNPFSPGLALLLMVAGLGMVGLARGASGRRLEASLRRDAQREPEF